MTAKTLIPLLFCYWALAGCGAHNKVRNAPDVNKTPGRQEEGGDAVSLSDLDTSMLSLTAGSRISTNDLLCQVWTLEDADKPHWDEFFWDSVNNAALHPEIALFRDKSVTVNPRGRIRTGKWELNKDTRELAIHFTDGSSATWFIRVISVKRMYLSRSQGGPGDEYILLSPRGVAHRRPEEDPYYPSNNLWRIKPRTPETNAQIRRRLKNYLHFFSLYFLDIYDRHVTNNISYIGLPYCFEWYNGGIGMTKESELETIWLDCFYSRQQAMEGYRLLEGILESHELKWPEHPTSWVQQEGQVLQQMADKL